MLWRGMHRLGCGLAVLSLGLFAFSFLWWTKGGDSSTAPVAMIASGALALLAFLLGQVARHALMRN